MDGKSLNGERADQMNAFLVRPLEWRYDKIGIARAFLVKNHSVVLNKALAHVEYAAIGELDSKLKLTTSNANGSLVRQDYKLLFDDKYVLPGRGNAPPDEITGPSRWRIEEVPTEQWISVNAAIRYVTQMRDATSDPVIKKNAEKTLDTLGGFR